MFNRLSQAPQLYCVLKGSGWCIKHALMLTRLLTYVQKELYEKSIAKEYVCFPTKVHTIGFTQFVQFRKHIKPFSIGYAWQHLRFFCLAVLIAIKRMHEAGFAHLDIRLENICFKVNSLAGRAVLIDLDRSR